MVSASTLVMGALCLVFPTTPSLSLTLPLSGFFGLAYGAFISVDWALAIDVLPAKSFAANDLSIEASRSRCRR
jgi:hypothetical protein